MENLICILWKVEKLKAKADNSNNSLNGRKKVDEQKNVYCTSKKCLETFYVHLVWFVSNEI